MTEEEQISLQQSLGQPNNSSNIAPENAKLKVKKGPFLKWQAVKIGIIIIAGLIAIVAIYLGWKAYKTTRPVKIESAKPSWVKYTGEEMSFEYSKGWKVQTDNGDTWLISKQKNKNIQIQILYPGNQVSGDAPTVYHQELKKWEGKGETVSLGIKGKGQIKAVAVIPKDNKNLARIYYVLTANKVFRVNLINTKDAAGLIARHITETIQ